MPGAEFVAQVPAGKRLCQAEELVPGDTHALQLTIGTYQRPGPPVVIDVTRGGRLLAGGGRAAGWTQGDHVRLPLVRSVPTTAGPEVCLTNSGPATLALGGSASVPPPARVDGIPQRGRVRIEYVRSGRESWWSLMPTIFHRFGLGKAPGLGSWTFVLAWGLVLAAAAIAGRLLWRGTRA